MKLISVKQNINELPMDLENYLSPNFIYIEESIEKQINDYIFKDEIILNNPCSISGKIIDLKSMSLNNQIKNTYVVENDFKEQRIKEVSLNDNIDSVSKEEFIKLLKDRLLTNLYNKFAEVENPKILVINAMDEMPYIFNELYRFKNYTNDILDSIDSLCNIIGIKKCYIVINSTYEKSIFNILKLIGMYPNIKVFLLPDKFLINQKNVLCNYLKIDSKSSMILSTFDIQVIREELYKNKKYVGKIITIYDESHKNIRVFNTLLNTSLKELFDDNNVLFNDKLIYINGTINGYIVDSIDNIIIDKNLSNVMLMNKESSASDCINCGACNKVCPKRINVKRLYDNNQKSSKCTGCGLCNYICPSNINLRSVFRGDDNE